MCIICDDKRYLVCTRSDGQEAIERCDECSADTLQDEGAALLALADGINCDLDYPCVIWGNQGER